jgi:hypothetical protein
VLKFSILTGLGESRALRSLLVQGPTSAMPIHNKLLTLKQLERRASRCLIREF